MRFLVDVQLPGALARWLRGRGLEAEHVLERGLAQSTDRELWKIAEKEGSIVVSKDEDFFILATRPGDEGRLLWIRLGNCRTRNLLTILNQRWNSIEKTFSDNQRVVEIRP